MYIIFGKKDSSVAAISVSGKIVSESEAVKLLGVKIDNKLSFLDHVSALSGRVSDKLASLNRIKKLFERSQKLCNLSSTADMEARKQCSAIGFFVKFC